MKQTFIAVLAVSLSGCFAIKYEAVPLDSYPPVNAAEVGRCPEQLKSDKTCVAQIYANRWASFTGIRVGSEGESYCVTVPHGQVWFDKDRRNTPPHGDEGSWLMKLAKRRYEVVPFFSLMIDVDRGGEDGDIQDTAVEVTDSNNFRFTSKAAGKLVLFPNDAMGSEGDPSYWYRNNSGHIWVTIQRCDAIRALRPNPTRLHGSAI